MQGVIEVVDNSPSPSLEGTPLSIREVARFITPHSPKALPRPPQSPRPTKKTDSAEKRGTDSELNRRLLMEVNKLDSPSKEPFGTELVK